MNGANEVSRLPECKTNTAERSVTAEEEAKSSKMWGRKGNGTWEMKKSKNREGCTWLESPSSLSYIQYRQPVAGKNESTIILLKMDSYLYAPKYIRYKRIGRERGQGITPCI